MSTLYVDSIQPKTTGSQLTIAPAIQTGAVLQVQSVASSAITTIDTQDTRTDIVGLSVAITPKSTSSKILVQVHISYGSSNINTYGSAYIMRNSTDIAIGTTATGVQQNVSLPLPSSGMTNEDYKLKNSSMAFLDEPQTTSAITYKVQARCDLLTTLYINRTGNDNNSDYVSRGISTLTVTEIGG